MKSAEAPSTTYRRTVFIGSEELLNAWKVCTGNATDIISVGVSDLSFAFELIEEAQPDVVIVEQAIAASGPGSILMDRLHNDRYLRGTEVRLLPPDRASDVLSTGPGELHPQDWLTVLTQALPPRPARRAERVPATGDEAVFIDGHPVTLIDLSAVGAQVRSSMVLKPRQRVRLVLPRDQGAVKAVAVVAWSRFEIGPEPTYRAGVAFTRALPDRS
jgi:hypothetical protein